MAVSLNDFLVSYYMQLHFDRMPQEVRARFDDYAARGDFKGSMKKWNDELKGHPLPNPNDPQNGIVQEDWEKFFNIFNTTLGRMAQDRDGLADNKEARDFISEYYGTGKLFSIEPVDSATESQISILKANLHRLKGAIQNFLPEDMSFDKFESDLRSNKYNTDGKFRNIFLNVVEKLDSAKQWGIQGASQDAKDALDLIHTESIIQGFDQKPSPGKLNSFKQEYKSILNRLHDKEKFRKMFSTYDDGKLSGQLSKALKKVNYDENTSDNKSYIHPKDEDELNLLQRVKKWVGDSYENHLEKYTKLRGDRMFFSEPAQMICKAIDTIKDPKIKPTDGIDAVIKRADDIKKGMQYKSPNANDHFDWFIKEMNSLKDAMPKAFEGSLRNGPQLRKLIEKLITDAVEQNKIKEAKTAMEVLSVIKYANTTSKIMDTIKEDKDLFNLFSNKDLSWNKNAGVEFVTTALDKSVRAAFIFVGYGATMAINGIRKSRSKIIRPGKSLNQARDEWQTDVNNQRTETQQINQNATNRKAQYLTVVQNSRRKSVIDNEIAQWEANVQRFETNIENNLQSLDQFLQQQTNGQPTQDPDLLAIQQYISDVVQYMQAQRNQPANGRTSNIPVTPILNGTGAQQATAVNAVGGNLQLWATQFRGLTTRQQELQDLLNARSELIAAHNQMQETRKKLDTWDTDHSDKYTDLINHWNRLETGRDSHTGEMYKWGLGSKKDKQDAFWRQQGGRGI